MPVIHGSVLSAINVGPCVAIFRPINAIDYKLMAINNYLTSFRIYFTHTRKSACLSVCLSPFI